MGVYLHIPFCSSFCAYCGFYSVVEECKMERYVAALLREIECRRGFFSDALSGPPRTLYIGGGTPSRLPLGLLSQIVQKLSEVFFADNPHGIKDVDEFTIEVNPDDITPEYAAGLRSLGANRISMGVQSFDDGNLRWMNRRHTSAQAVAAFDILRSAGFDNISIDLIFGYRPVGAGAVVVAPAVGDGADDFAAVGSGTTDSSADASLLEKWKKDLDTAIALRPEHISAYQMSLEPDSALGDLAVAGKYSEPDSELCAAQYEMLQSRLAAAGYLQYEISNFSLPGRKALHNSSYWERRPYLGLGPSAHSFKGSRRSWNSADIDKYIALYSDKGTADDPLLRFESDHEDLTPREAWDLEKAKRFESDYENLTPENILDETVMLGLRKVDGFCLSDIDVRYRDRISSRAQELAKRGLLSLSGDNIRIPPDRLFISEFIIGELL